MCIRDRFQTYNINADDAACAIAKAVHAEKLAFLSDIEGVYKDKDDPSSLISELHVHEAEAMIGCLLYTSKRSEIQLQWYLVV